MTRICSINRVNAGAYLLGSREYQKRVTTRAVRMPGPFIVETSEGPLRCEDGYLAIDARGYPYPISADEFELIYKEVKVDLFTNRTPTDEQGAVLDTITDQMLETARLIESLPESRFRSLAMTKLEECSMWAKKATVFTVGTYPVEE